MLLWLDPDRERAGIAYEQVRRRLTTIFAARNCPVPEDLADETIDRVARRVADIVESYAGDKAKYFFGVATNVHHEYLKRPSPPERGEALISHDSDQERTYACLDQCLGKLPGAAKELLLHYYAEERQAKIALHQRMAAELGISINTLRLRILRMKEKLQPCVERCVAKAENLK